MYISWLCVKNNLNAYVKTNYSKSTLYIKDIHNHEPNTIEYFNLLEVKGISAKEKHVKIGSTLSFGCICPQPSGCTCHTLG